MSKEVITSVAILVLVMGTASNMVFHMAEARSMPQHLLDSISTKEKFLLVKNENSSEKKYPKIIGYAPF